MNLSPDDMIAVYTVGIFVFLVVGYVFVQAFMAILIFAVFIIPALLYSFIIFAVGYVAYRVVKVVKWVFGSVYRVATVAVIATGIVWAGGYVNMTVSMLNRVVGVFS